MPGPRDGNSPWRCCGARYSLPLFVVTLMIYLIVNLTLSRLAAHPECRLSGRGRGRG